MAMTPFGGLVPRVHPSAYVHPSVELLGDVELAELTSIWPTAVLRGDSGRVLLGARTNFQDGSVAHATQGISTTSVGSGCTVGHRVILHGCTIGASCLVGMGSIVLDNVEVGDECFIGAGSLLTPGKKFPSRSFIMGSPAKRVREVSTRDLEWIAHSCQTYLDLAKTYRGQ